ncbi:2-oxo-3-deoxygalactonate kinase [Sphingomonas ginsenosidimutans]|jgi:2-dehydro-3-deoxygalactonokinase|uniref:2-oxo-3-deoxygalactonate kinase n=1 Tax=Sphingomonas ginsenosidimutans TaxID=862134 RepID=A0A2A4HYP2_9SPHN|nr:2-dehydro-3-deoxygalactonokinase [Sphingomonas ginsenosidimutans]PCG10002.1 2-oxo-3-deoxygalactonate kinase [Sphingomonas ginsenosidimutans]
MNGEVIAVDWGTTNRRAYRLAADGGVLATVCDDRGILSLAPADYPAAVAALRARLGEAPLLIAGMAGSTRGWREIPYVDAPADLAALAGGVIHVARDVAIVPGVALRGSRHDVMRGEEVQALGAITAGLAPRDALFCQPGTHDKWITVADARIHRFATAMTGELFALLRTHGILSGMLDAPVVDGAAFRDGVARGAGATDLLDAMFEVRARVLLGTLAPGDAASFASGVLIGADVGARGDLAGGTVHLLATGALAALYTAAIALRGGRVVAIDSAAAFTAGIHALHALLPGETA